MIHFVNKRIPYHAKAFRAFVKYLNENYDTGRKLHVIVLNYQNLNSLTEELGVKLSSDRNMFGCFGPSAQLVYIACKGRSVDQSLMILAHEFEHHRQSIHGRAMNEEKADAVGLRLVMEYTG